MERAHGYCLLCVGFMVLCFLSLGTIAGWEIARFFIINPPWYGTALQPMTPGKNTSDTILWDPSSQTMRFQIDTSALNPQDGFIAIRTATVCVNVPVVDIQWKIQAGIRPDSVEEYPAQSFNVSACADLVLCSVPSPSIYLSLESQDESAGEFSFVISTNNKNGGNNCSYADARHTLQLVGRILISVCIVLGWISGLCVLCTCYLALVTPNSKSCREDTVPLLAGEF